MGLSLPIDGSKDKVLYVKRFTTEDLTIGDWMREPDLTQNHFKDVKVEHDNNYAIEFVAEGEYYW